MRSQYSAIVTPCTKLSLEAVVNPLWLIWAIPFIASVPTAMVCCIVALRHRRMGWLIAIPLGVALGALAAPTVLLGSYIFLIGWFAAAFVWVIAGAWHRYVTDVWTIEVAIVALFVLAWFLAGSFSDLIQPGESVTKVLGDAWLLASPLVATIIVLEFAAASWDWMRPRSYESLGG
jgi:hypothetical protein